MREIITQEQDSIYEKSTEFATDQSDIPSIDRAIESVRSWAEYRDSRFPPADSESTNVEIVERLLSDTSATDRAYFRGYNGTNTYPIYMNYGKCTHRRRVDEVFGANIFTGEYNPKGMQRTQNILQQLRGYSTDNDEHTEPSSVLDRDDSDIQNFVIDITAAHKVYQYLYDSTTRSFNKEMSFNGEFRVMPGEEFKEKFWNAKLLGKTGAPGIVEVDGTLKRLHENINAFAAEEYGEDAAAFVEAWWAVANLIKPAKNQNFEQASAPIIDALKEKDLGSANMLLKKCLYEDEDMLPYGSRKRLALTPEEKEFFDELQEEEKAERKARQGHKPPKKDLTPLIDLPEQQQTARLKDAASYMGFLVSAKVGERDKVFIVRDVVPVRDSEASRGSEETESKLRWDVVLDYCKIQDDGIVLKTTKATGKRLPVDRFAEIIEGGADALDADDAYLDKDKKTFRLQQ